MTSNSPVLYLGPKTAFDAVADVFLGTPFEVRSVEPTVSGLRAGLATACALIDSSMKVPISDELIRNAPRLRIISCATTGSDHIAREEVQRRGIALRTLREDPELLRNLTPAAEHSWALLLACARRLVAAHEHVLKGGWDRVRFPGTMIRGRRLGLVGCGRIGQWMARYGLAFGMDVVGFDPHITPWPSGIQPSGLGDLFRESDFISLHVHLTDETLGMVDSALLEQVKPGAVLINTSRGGLLDESAVLACLARGRLGAFGADVLGGEPEISEHPLVTYAASHSNVILTPHIGGFSPDAVRLVCRRAAEKALDLLERSE